MTNLTEQLVKENKELEERNNGLHKLISELNEDNKRLKHDVGNLGYKIKNQRHEIDNRLKEIEKLKELLKECKHIMSIEKDFASCHFEKDKLCKLITERLEKQLEIAVEGLKKYAEKEKFVMQVREKDIIVGYRPFYDEGEFARKKLKQIEELNNG